MEGVKEMKRYAHTKRNRGQAKLECHSRKTFIRVKPQFIKRTRDYMVLSNVKLFEDILAGL